jgi:hypothetical protein
MSYLQGARTLTSALLLTCTLTLAAYGAKNRDWQIGRVLDSAMSREVYVTGAVTNTSGMATVSGNATASTTANAMTIGNAATLQSSTAISGTTTARGQSTSSTAIQRVAVQTNELVIVADKYLYVIEDSRTYMPGAPLMNALANRKRGCRFVVGEDITYAQEKGYLWVLDPDGRECKIPIRRQQVRDAAFPKGAEIMASVAGGAPSQTAAQTAAAMVARAVPTAASPVPTTSRGTPDGLDGYHDLTQAISVGPGYANTVYAAFGLKP